MLKARIIKRQVLNATRVVIAGLTCLGGDDPRAILGSAQAQQIFRCGASYSAHDQCNEGPAMILSGLAKGPDKTRSEPTDITQRMQAQANQLERNRLQEAHAVETLQKDLTSQTHRGAQKPSLQKNKPGNNAAYAQLGNRSKREKLHSAQSYFTAKQTRDTQKP